MESEIISICLNLFHGPDGAGTTTSGGTESILLSVKTHRDWARQTKSIISPEMVIPSSAHAAFWKASQYFGVKLHVVPVDQDPIPALGKLAKRHNIGLHVDCCLGSFLMPFLERAGLGDGMEKFDFGVDGVTSISCDIHKYAFCSSVIMYRSRELRRYQYYVITDWAGGVYASPSMAGSRPGSILAGAWAVLNHVGINGYTDSCRSIVTAARNFADTLRTRFPIDLFVLGEPQVSVVAFGSKTFNIYAIGDRMSSGSKLIEDLEEVVEEVKKSPTDEGDLVALYGLGQTSAGPHVVGKVAETYLDVCLE
ncbi:MAG: hypothetical protein TREMPRED_002526 [Tremellales sp. Tagirdzhanova-0007]|nr:MAG: hypothetical protein TREMPRED_002526 [Tremellales sp. Tagirdzhanova-0007]